jgi:hypothetical protein
MSISVLRAICRLAGEFGIFWIRHPLSIRAVFSGAVKMEVIYKVAGMKFASLSWYGTQ